VLDVGCGRGLDGEVSLQLEIADTADQMWGCEPDTTIRSSDSFHQIFPNTLEESAIPQNSVHVAYSAFVVEHISDPAGFFSKMHDCLVEGGIFLGMTDYRWSFFSTMSQIMEWTRVKNFYLNLVKGRRGEERYENYPTFYRANTAEAVKRHTPLFRQHYFTCWHRYGEIDHYLPRALRPLGWGVDALSMAGVIPRQIFIIGLQK
jgi:SAM-dependent methyltransferase